MELPQVIYKNHNFLIINKPAGLLVHTSERNGDEEKSLVDWLMANYPETSTVGDDPVNRPGIVHRLDKDTSGIMLIVLNQKSFEYFKKLFQEHQVKKTYLALVCGAVKDEKGVIDKPIGIKSGTTKRTVHSSKMQKQAVTEYKIVKRLTIDNRDYTLLQVEPKTGRTHQIRVHLAFIGYPIAGDKLYGGAKAQLKNLTRQFLHAQAIEFTAPSGERMKFESELPEELKSLIN